MAEAKYGTVSISELARALGIDRRTVVKRLEPLGSEATLEEIIAALITSNGIEESRRLKIEAEAKRLQLKLQAEQGRLLPKEKVILELVRVFKSLHDHFFLVQPREIAQLVAGKSEKETVKLIREYNATFFKRIRSDYTSLFGSLDAGDTGSGVDSD